MSDQQASLEARLFKQHNLTENLVEKCLKATYNLNAPVCLRMPNVPEAKYLQLFWADIMMGLGTTPFEKVSNECYSVKGDLKNIKDTEELNRLYIDTTDECSNIMEDCNIIYTKANSYHKLQCSCANSQKESNRYKSSAPIWLQQHVGAKLVVCNCGNPLCPLTTVSVMGRIKSLIQIMEGESDIYCAINAKNLAAVAVTAANKAYIKMGEITKCLSATRFVSKQTRNAMRQLICNEFGSKILASLKEIVEQKRGNYPVEWTKVEQMIDELNMQAKQKIQTQLIIVKEPPTKKQNKIIFVEKERQIGNKDEEGIIIQELKQDDTEETLRSKLQEVKEKIIKKGWVSATVINETNVNLENQLWRHWDELNTKLQLYEKKGKEEQEVEDVITTSKCQNHGGEQLMSMNKLQETMIAWKCQHGENHDVIFKQDQLFIKSLGSTCKTPKACHDTAEAAVKIFISELKQNTYNISEGIVDKLRENHQCTTCNWFSCEPTCYLCAAVRFLACPLDVKSKWKAFRESFEQKLNRKIKIEEKIRRSTKTHFGAYKAIGR